MNQPNLEQQCKSLFGRCVKDLEGIFSIRKSDIRIVTNGDGLYNKDTIRIFLLDQGKWKQICEVYPLNSKAEFKKEYSNLKMYNFIKKQLNHFGYIDIEESEFYRGS